MLKLLGSLCILAAGGGAWMGRVRSRRGEIFSLEQTISALGEMEDAIRLECTPLPRLLARQAEKRSGETGAFFLSVRRGLDRGEMLPAAWRSAAAALSWRGADALAELGGQLTGDAEQTCKAIRLARGSLIRTLEELRRQKPEDEKRSAALCFSGAALLILLLI
jgi:stage III sporulation protein AB